MVPSRRPPEDRPAGRIVLLMRVLLVLIGPQWLATDPVRPGRLLIERADDWVRPEVRRALERDIAVVPVLLDGVGRPDPSLLPDDVRSLAYLQVAEVRHQNLGADARRLADYLVTLVPELASFEVHEGRGPRQLPPGSGQHCVIIVCSRMRRALPAIYTLASSCRHVCLVGCYVALALLRRRFGLAAPNALCQCKST